MPASFHHFSYYRCCLHVGTSRYFDMSNVPRLRTPLVTHFGVHTCFGMYFIPSLEHSARGQYQSDASWIVSGKAATDCRPAHLGGQRSSLPSITRISTFSSVRAGKRYGDGWQASPVAYSDNGAGDLRHMPSRCTFDTIPNMVSSIDG